MRNKKLLLVLIGNTGTGKTTFATQLNNRCKIVTHIECDDYSNDPREGFRLAANIIGALNNNQIVVLDGNHVSRDERRRLLLTLKQDVSNIEFICIDFGPGDNESLQRRLKNTPLTEEKVLEVHNKYMSQYIKPTLREGFKKIKTYY